jgi:dihydroxyacetone kinase-like predicted kinase
VHGLVDGHVVEQGSDAAAVAVAVANRMLSAGGELLTLVTGAAPDAASTADAVSACVRGQRPDVEVSIVTGGQLTSLLLLGVE